MKIVGFIAAVIVALFCGGAASSQPFAGPGRVDRGSHSAYVYYAPGPAGTADVRFEYTDAGGVPVRPIVVKYAGFLETVGDFELDPRIQVNGIPDGKTVYGVIQYVDKVGPVPEYNLMDVDDRLLTPGGAPPAAGTMASGEMRMLGSNMGRTADGLISINGEGLWSNRPRVLAQTGVIELTAAPAPTKPAGARGYWASTLDSPLAISAPKVTNAASNTLVYTFTDESTKEAGLLFDQALDESRGHKSFFTDGLHFMTVISDGGEQGLVDASHPSQLSDPLHSQHGYFGIQPAQTEVVGSGDALYLSMSVNANVVDGRKAPEIFIQPATDMLTNFSAPDVVPAVSPNVSNHFIRIQPGNNCWNVVVGAGFAGHSHKQLDIDLDGAPGDTGTQHYTSRAVNGDPDDQSLFEVWLSASGVVVKCDGQTVVDNSWTVATGNNSRVYTVPVDVSWLFSKSGVKAEYAGIVYHLSLCADDERKYDAADTYNYEPLAGNPDFYEQHWSLIRQYVAPASAGPAIVP